MPGLSVLIQPNPPRFTIKAVTNDLLQALGKSKNDLVGKDYFDPFPANPADHNFNGQVNLRGSLEAALVQKQTQYLPVQRYDVPDEEGVFSERWWSVSNKPVLNDDMEVIYIIHTATEITERILAERREGKIRDNEQTYNLFLQAPVAVGIIKGPEQIIELANDSLLQIWRKGKEVIGRPLLEALPEIKGSIFPELLHRVRLTGETYKASENHAYFLRNGKEELVYFNFVYQPYFEDLNDTPVGVLAVANEVTEQVIARKKVEESEQRFRNLITEAAVATALYAGPQMTIQYANEAMIKLWGKDASVIGKTVKEALPELEGQPFHQLLADVYETGETYWGKEDRGELKLDGKLQTFYFNFSYKALRNADGKIYGILNMAIDVTEQVLAKEKVKESESLLQHRVVERTLELENKNKELERSNANLEEFAYAASHDMKEPIRKIHFFSDRLKQKLSGKIDEEEERLFERMQYAARRMGTLIDDLLTFSHVSREGGLPDDVNLNQKIKLVTEDLELEIQEKGAQITVDTLPTIKGHKRQIQQLFQNLIGNALKYAKPNISPQINITCRKVSGAQSALSLSSKEAQQLFYEIAIADNGIGFEQKDAERIFNVFTRLHGNTEYKGTGVGLSIVRKVVENHKGFIYAKSNPGEGATFYIGLPAD